MFLRCLSFVWSSEKLFEVWSWSQSFEGNFLWLRVESYELCFVYVKSVHACWVYVLRLRLKVKTSLRVIGFVDQLGWEAQGQGKSYYDIYFGL